MIFEQVRHGGCLSYLIGCEETRTAIVVDPDHAAPGTAARVAGDHAAAQRRPLHRPARRGWRNLDRCGWETARILVYCQFGKVSTLAAHTLRTMGYTRTVALDGGLDGWTKAGYPLVAEPA